VTSDGNVSVLIWTTTPWTLPANTAAALSEKASYGCFKIPGDDKRAEEYVILLASQADAVLKGSKAERVASDISGDRAGRSALSARCSTAHVNLHGQPVDTSRAYRTITDPPSRLAKAPASSTSPPPTVT
jgi:hypothetical protein